jgi:hypothetical protein
MPTEYVPEAHGVHVVAPDGAYVPALHGVHTYTSAPAFAEMASIAAVVKYLSFMVVSLSLFFSDLDSRLRGNDRTAVKNPLQVFCRTRPPGTLMQAVPSVPPGI